MQDFRMKMLNGESIPNCEFCHRMEASGLTSKRIGKNKRFLEKTKPFLEKYYKENGFVDIMPQWWEIRLSTKCNLSCIMCAPVLSSMMYKEYEKWSKDDNLTRSMQGSLWMAKASGGEYLSRSDFFKNQIIENLQNCAFMEFRGGEVFADRDSIDFIETISNTQYAKNIKLDISTNATLIDSNIIEILNKFNGGMLRFSIDAFQDEDKYIRYHTKWDKVIQSMKISAKLHTGWLFLTQTTVQSANCTTLDKLIVFFDKFIQKEKLNRFFLGFTTVRGKDWLRHEMIPNTLRNVAIEKLENLKTKLYIFNESENANAHRKSLDMLISTLQSKEYPKGQLQVQAIEYYEKLSELRKVDYFEIFPCLRSLYD
jgi:sulfatase maturation enzyme AslB (radical SAM superfamily)